MTRVVEGMEGMRALVGEHLGWSSWHEVDQKQVDLFADATGDHQWIHVDPERAAESPFGGTIAHGYLTLALAPVLLSEVVSVEGVAFGVNYGCNKVRFPSPVLVGAKVRLGATVVAVDDVPGGAQVTLGITIEAEGSTKPSCAAEVLYRYFTEVPAG